MRASYAATVTGFPHPAVTPGAPPPLQEVAPEGRCLGLGLPGLPEHDAGGCRRGMRGRGCSFALNLSLIHI